MDQQPKSFFEQESLSQKPRIKDPELRNGLKAKRLQPRTELNNAQIITWGEIQGNPTDNDNLVAAFGNLQTALGYTPLDPNNNLSELTNLTEAMMNLGLDLGGVNDIWLHRVGDTMAGTILLAPQRPLKFQAGILPDPELGTMDFDGAQLFFTPSTSRRALEHVSDVADESTTVSNSAIEVPVFSATLDENLFAVSEFFKILLYGRYSTANGSDTVTIRFKVQGSTILSFTTTAASVTDAPLFSEFMVTLRTIGDTGTFWAYLQAVANNINKHTCVTSDQAIDTTAPTDLEVTVQWSNALSGNTLSIDQSLLVMD